jgi:hypothetical protein
MEIRVMGTGDEAGNALFHHHHSSPLFITINDSDGFYIGVHRRLVPGSCMGADSRFTFHVLRFTIRP